MVEKRGSVQVFKKFKSETFFFLVMKFVSVSGVVVCCCV